MALLARWDSAPHFSHAKCLKADYKAAAETKFFVQFIAPLDQKMSLSKRLS
jgi:hypothetical protein